MFETNADPCCNTEALYLKKKKVFHQAIRRQQRQSTLQRLREQAMISAYSLQLVNNLPGSVRQVVELIQKNTSDTVLSRVIANKIMELLRIELGVIFDLKVLPYIKQIVVFTFLVRTVPSQICPIFAQIYCLLKQSAQKKELSNLLLPVISMVKRKENFVLEWAKQLLFTIKQDRFYYCELLFYDCLLKNCPSTAQQMGLVDEELMVKLSKHMQIQFYDTNQRIKMAEILIQILYTSHKQTASSCLDLESFYPTLEYYIAYCSESKILSERCLILIFNIIIDRGSQQFTRSKCWTALIAQILSFETPRSIKKLTGEVFLASVINYPSSGLINYVKRENRSIFMIVEHLLQQFMYDKEMVSIVTNLLQDLISAGNQQQQTQIKNLILSHPQCVNSLRKIQNDFHFLSRWELL